MKKILTFLLTLWLFAPDISALDEEVYLGFWIPSGTNVGNQLSSEAGVYSKKDGDEAPSRDSYTATVRYALQQNSTTLNTAKFIWNDGVSTIGTIQQFNVEKTDIPGLGFSVTFNGILRSSWGYALRLQTPSSSNAYGAYNGLCLSTPSYPYYTTITITSTETSRPIKKVKFGKSKPQVTGSSSSFTYSESSFTGTETIDNLFTRVNEEGEWEFDQEDNCWTYVFYNPVQSVDIRAAVMNDDASSLHLNKLGIVWDVPIEAPTINNAAVPTDGKLTLTGTSTYSYNYYNTPAVLKCFTMPAGCKDMVYATADVPTENWRVYDPATGIELPANAVWNQETLVQIAGRDADGNVGLPLVINCKRLEPEAPNRPQAVRYAKSFNYTDAGTNSTLRYRTFPTSRWIDLSNQNQNNLSIEVDGNALVLDLYDAYSSALTGIGLNTDTKVTPVGTLEYAITSNITPPDNTSEQQFQPATVNPGSTAAADCDESDLSGKTYFGPQYGWFVYGQSDNNNGSPNTGRFNLTNSSPVQYLHLRAYTQFGDDKFYSPVTTIAITRTPLAGPVLSMPEDENYTWVGGAIARMSYAQTAILNIDLPGDTPEGTKVQYAYDGATELGLEPSPTAYINYLKDPSNGTDDYVYPSNQQCLIQLGGNFGIGANNGVPYAGRLFVRTYNPTTGQASEWSIVDVDPIITQNYYMDGYGVPVNGYSQNDLVTLYGGYVNDKMRVVDVFSTDAGIEAGKVTYYVYLENYKNDAIKLVINSATEPPILKRYKEYVDADGYDCVIYAGDIIGRVAYRNFVAGNGTMPEILITPNKDESFINYLPQPHAELLYAGVAQNNCPDVTSVTEADFNKKVRLRGLEKIAGSSRMRGIDGTEYTIYTRLHLANENEVEEAFANMEDGNVYAVTCFVGQTVGSLALLPCDFPIECPDTPEIFAPNPITDGALDAISPELTITIGNIRQHDMTYYWTDKLNLSDKVIVDITPDINDLYEIKKEDYVKGVPTFTIKKSDYTVDDRGKLRVTLSVYAQSKEGLWSIEPAIIQIDWHELDENHGTVSTIAEFKELYLNDKDLPESISERMNRDRFNATHYHQFSNLSEAVVIEATEEWLYIRDLNPTRDDNKFNSENYILVHNENKWVNPPVPVAGEQDSVRMLRQGDKITNFALIPALSRRGNLISESTGFARTVHYIDSIPNFQLSLRPIFVGYSDETVMPDPDNDDYSGYYANIILEENQRMRYLDIRNVKIEKKGQDYYLVLGEGNIALAFDIFEECYNGWDNFYNPDNPDELYNIKGIFLKNEKDRDESYAIAMIDFSTNNGQVAAPKLYSTEAANKEAELQYFVNNLKVNIEHEEGSMVFYSINGADPKNMTPDKDGNYPNRLSYDGEFSLELPANSDRITVKAYAYRPGYKPSATVSRIFVRNSTELQYIFQFLDQARAGRYYRLTSNLKVIATGGKYMFLAGPMGYFLPVINEDGWDNTDLTPGRYVKNFTVGYMQDSHDNRIAVATGHMSTFDKITSPLWEGDKQTPEADEFHAQPDTLSAVTVLNARRLVTLMGATVNDGHEQTVDGDDIWYIQDRETGQNIPMYVGRLGKVSAGSYTSDGNRVQEELQDGKAYNITGFVMLGDPTNREGEVEFWPLQADRVTLSSRANAEFTNTIGNVDHNNSTGDYNVNFNGTTTVTLKSSRQNSNATIYYSFASHPLNNGRPTWYTYQHPIIVDNSDVIRVKCQEPSFDESEIILINLNKVDRAGDVNFNVTSEYGKTTVKLSSDEQGAVIYYGFNDPSCPNRYRTELEYTRGGKLYACVQVPGKPRGAVSILQVMVVGGESSSVSGNVKFELEENAGGTKVKISPVDNLVSGSYSIYYTLESGVPFAEDTWIKYDGSFEMKESGLIMAVLVENNKPRGQISETFVWVYVDPAGIDGVDSDRAEETVTVSGSDIVAPEGSMVFDLMGRRVNAEGLRPGIYIVRTPAGDAVKVQIR